MTKRTSTTSKITLAHVKHIESDVENGNGVLIRYRRQTLGVIGVERIGGKVFFKVHETSALIPRIGCSIRKTTVAAWNSGAAVTMNVGRKVGKYGLLDDQFVRSRIAYCGVYNASKSFREAIGEWEGADEPAIIAAGRTTLSRCDLIARIVSLADELGQEAIAVEIDGVGSLAWGERGKRNYTFNPAYFIR